MDQANKQVTMAEAIARFVPDGASVLVGAQMEQMIPFAAGHEIIRQRKRGLTLIGPISDILIDQMIGAGVAARVLAAWVGNVSVGLAHNFRRAVEQGIPRPIEVVDYSNFTLALALHAAALGLPFMPTYSTLGSDVLAHNPFLKPMVCPITSKRLVAVEALAPDVAIIHAQRADEAGNAHLWGSLGVAVDGLRAAKTVIVTAEEIVSAAEIASDPNRTLVPGFLVSAVVEEPWGAHPSPVLGYYNRDHKFYQQYHEQSRTLEDLQKWLRRWLEDVPDRRAYMERVGEGRRDSLCVQEHAYSVPADFGY